MCTSKPAISGSFPGRPITPSTGPTVNRDFGGGWWDNGIGLNMQINDRHNIYMDANYAKGSRFDQKQFNIGYRYSF